MLSSSFLPAAQSWRSMYENFCAALVQWRLPTPQLYTYAIVRLHFRYRVPVMLRVMHVAVQYWVILSWFPSIVINIGRGSNRTDLIDGNTKVLMFMEQNEQRRKDHPSKNTTRLRYLFYHSEHPINLRISHKTTKDDHVSLRICCRYIGIRSIPLSL